LMVPADAVRGLRVRLRQRRFPAQHPCSGVCSSSAASLQFSGGERPTRRWACCIGGAAAFSARLASGPARTRRPASAKLAWSLVRLIHHLLLAADSGRPRPHASLGELGQGIPERRSSFKTQHRAPGPGSGDNEKVQCRALQVDRAREQPVSDPQLKAIPVAKGGFAFVSG